MKTKLRALAAIVAIMTILGNLAAQDSTLKPTPDQPNAEKKEAPAAPVDGNEKADKEELRLTGEWEVFFGGAPSGIYLDLRHISFRVHGIYGDIQPNEKLGISKGQEFFRATVRGNQGKGEILLRKRDKESRELVKEMSPFKFKILDEGERLDCEIGGDKVKEDARKFQLRRIARMKNFRLLVKTPDGFQPANKIVEDMPMAIEGELSSPSKKKFPITLKSGDTSITLDAKYVPQKDTKGKVFNIAARTPLFYPTFGRQIGVKESGLKAKEEKWGREPTEDDWKTLVGVWRTGYMDKELGEVKGWAEFKNQGSAKFSYQHPESEDWRYIDLVKSGVLDSSDPKMPRKWKFKFEGRGVDSEEVKATKKEDLKELLLDPQVPPVEITHEKLEASIQVERSRVADYQTLYMELAQQPNEGLMVWNWSYQANRETERDRTGFGRVGALEVTDPNSRVGTMRGREAWMKNSPNILASFCTENQTAIIKTPLYDRPVPRYRYGSSKHKIIKNGKPQDETVGQNKGVWREVFIVATDIPENVERPVRIKAAEGSGISYYKIEATGPEGKITNSDKLKKAWKTYRASQKAASSNGSKSAKVTSSHRFKAEGTAELEKLSQSPPMGILVHAGLKDKAEPGIQKFTLNDVPGEWKLEFGDTVAKPQWLRRIATGEEGEAAEWEHVAVAFRPETVRIALTSQQSIKAQKEMTASILIGSKRIAYDTGTGQPPTFKIPLKPDPNEKNRYISPPIHLVSKIGLAKAKEANPSGFFVVCNNDDVITSQFQSRTLYTIAPRTADLKVSISPDSMNALWKAALKKAADAAGQPITDWDAVAQGEAEEVTNYILTNLVIPGESVARSLKIRIGDHAAMLLLRDVFVEMMDEQLSDWYRNQSPQKIESIFRAQRAALGGRQSPLSYYKIPLQKLPQFRGSSHDDEVYLYQVFDDSTMTQDYGYKGPQYSLQLSAFTYAWKNYGGDMAKSISDAKRIKVADVRGLLKLTGYSFQSIVKRLLPRLMKLEINAKAQTSQWVPDKIARAYVKSLETIGAAVKAQEDYSKADTSFMLTAASLVTIPLGNAGGFWSAMAVAGMSAVELGHAVYNDVYQQWDMDDQIKEEVAKGAVLGVGRAAQKQSEKLATWQKVLSVGGAALGGAADGLDVLKAVKGLKSAEVLAAGAEILKKADIADPAALRKLSTADQAVLKRIADEAAELASQGRTADLTDLQKAALNQADELDIIYQDKAVKAMKSLSAEDAAEQAASITKKADLTDVKNLEKLSEADLTLLKRVSSEANELKKAGKPLSDAQKAALHNARNIDEAYNGIPKVAAQKAIADKFAAASKPVSKKSLEAAAKKLEIAADDVGAVGKKARKRMNDAKDAYEEAVAAAKKKPSTEAAEKVSASRKAYKEAKKNSEITNDLAGDLKQRAQAAKTMVNEGKKTGKNVRLTRADRKLLNVDPYKGDLADVLKRQNSPNPKAMTKQDRDIFRKISGMSKSEVDDVENLIKAKGGDWSQLKKMAGGSGRDQLNMHRVAAYRRLKMNKLADESIAETTAFLKRSGVDDVYIERNAFGSANLTSDYDVALKGPGAELAVQNFNQKVRKLFKGTESGAVVDTNLYTDPIYNIYKQTDLADSSIFQKGKRMLTGDVAPDQIDKARQFVFQQMANAKYRIQDLPIDSPARMRQWNKFKDNILDGVPPKSRKAVEDMMDQAEGARKLAEQRIADKLKDVAGSAKKVDGNDKLRVTNELYGDTLTDIHHYRRMLEDLDEVRNGFKDIRDINLPPALHKPEFAESLNEIKKLLDNDATKARGLQELDELKRQAAINIRSKQGEALYYASEAYQTRGTIGHVVGELQAGGQKVTLDSLSAGRNTDAVKNSKLSRDDYVNSFYENGGNLMKELNSKGIFDEATGNLKSFPNKAAYEAEKYSAAGQKVAKYFERQLDAAAKAGVDMKALMKDDELKKVMDATIQLNGARNNPAEFNALVKKLMGSEKAFVKKALELNDVLEKKVISQSDMVKFADKLGKSEEALTKAGVKLAKGWEQVPFVAGKQLQGMRHVSNNLLTENERFKKESHDSMSLLTGKERDRTLSEPERKRLQNYRKQATALKDLNTQATAARAAGVAAERIDSIVAKTKESSPDNWQAAAATEVNKELQKKTAATVGAQMKSGRMSPFLRDRLGLPGTGAPASSATELSAQLKKAGKYVRKTGKPLTLSQLNSQASAGRKALVMVRDAEGTPTWKEMRGVSIDSGGRKLVRVRDAESGAEFSMPEALFNARSQNASHQVVVDPFRDADGNITITRKN